MMLERFPLQFLPSSLHKKTRNKTIHISATELGQLHDVESWNLLCPRYFITPSLLPEKLLLYLRKQGNEQFRGHLLSVD